MLFVYDSIFDRETNQNSTTLNIKVFFNFRFYGDFVLNLQVSQNPNFSLFFFIAKILKFLDSRNSGEPVLRRKNKRQMWMLTTT